MGFYGFQRINRDQSLFSFGVVRPTAPGPVLRVKDEFSLQRVSAHVVEFFMQLVLTPHVEVVKAPLPERARLLLFGSEGQSELLPRDLPFALAQRPRLAREESAGQSMRH